MAQFRKKPVVIDAFQWTGGPDQLEDPEWFVAALQVPMEQEGSAFFVSTALYIHTLEGNMLVSVGDWVIRGIKGEIYPCKPDIFALTYDPA